MDASATLLDELAPAPVGKRVFAAAVTVFLLDGLYVVAVFAWILRLTTAERIFRGIAAAVLGPDARTLWWSAGLGVAMHFLVALGWTTMWALMYGRSASLRARLTSGPVALAVGAAYGVAVWLVMQLAILPLTRTPPGPLFTLHGMLVLIAHLLVVGPPIVLLVRRRGRSGDG